MDKSSPAPVHPRATGVRELLGQLQGEHVAAVVLFGSVARGDCDEQSDLDVLVVVEDGEGRQAVLAAFRQQSREDHPPLVMTVAALLQEAVDRPSFVAHLLDEGILLCSKPSWGRVRSSLSDRAFDRDALGREVRNRAKHLEPLLRAGRFRNSPVTALSHLYGIARSLAILRLLQEGIHEYSWQRAFDRYAELRPELGPDLQSLKDLRPYYEYARARGRTEADLPPEPMAASEMRALAGSVAHLAE